MLFIQICLNIQLCTVFADDLNQSSDYRNDILTQPKQTLYMWDWMPVATNIEININC